MLIQYHHPIFSFQMLKLQSLSSGLRSSLQRQALSTANADLHYSSRGKNWRKQYDPGYFYDGVDLGPSVGRVNIRDFKFDKFCVRNLTRLRLVDNSKLSTAAMEYRMWVNIHWHNFWNYKYDFWSKFSESSFSIKSLNDVLDLIRSDEINKLLSLFMHKFTKLLAN